MTAAALLVAALVAAGAVAARRRWRGASGPPPLAVEARAALGRDSGLALVRVAGRALVVGWSPGGVRLVARLDREGAP